MNAVQTHGVIGSQGDSCEGERMSVVECLTKVKNDRVRKSWLGNVMAQMEAASVETGHWWLVEAVEAFFDCIEQNSNVEFIFGAVYPAVELFSDGRCQLDFADTSHLVSCKPLSHQRVATTIEAGEIGEALIRLTAESNDALWLQRFLAAPKTYEYRTPVTLATLQWFLDRDLTVMSEITFGMLGLVVFFEESEFVLVEGPEAWDKTKDKFELVFLNRTERYTLTFHMDRLEASRKRLTAHFNETLASATPEPQ